MNRIISWRTISALGLATAIAVAAGIEVTSAQTEPRALPNLQNQQDRLYDRGNDGQYGGQSDLRRERGVENRDRRGFGNPEERLDRRLAFLHTRLRITPAQERAWTVFSGVLQDEARERMGSRGGAFRGERDQDMSVMERLEMRQHRLADRNTDLDRVIRAVRPLYGQFSEDQKRVADRLMFRPERNRRMADAGRGRERPGFDRGGFDRRNEGSPDRYSR